MDYRVMGITPEQEHQFLNFLKGLGLRAVRLKKQGWVDADPLNKSDLRGYAKDAGVTLATVIKLLKGGIDADDISEVLDIRSYMTFRRPGDEAIIAMPTVDIMIKAYNMCEGDIDQLTMVADLAMDKLSNIGYSKVRVRHISDILMASIRDIREEDAPEKEDYN